MTYQTIPPSSSGSSSTAATPVISRAQTLLGAANITKIFGPGELDDATRFRNGGTSGTISVTTTKKGGVQTLTTTATSARSAILMPISTTEVLLDNALASYWYLASRFSVTTAIDAQAGADLRWTATTPGAPQIVLGVIGSLSTSFYSWLTQNNGGSITASGVTTVAIDTAMHVWEAYSDTTTISFAIDGTVGATTLASNAGTGPVVPAINVANGSTSAARTVDADYLWVCTGNPA